MQVIHVTRKMSNYYIINFWGKYISDLVNDLEMTYKCFKTFSDLKIK